MKPEDDFDPQLELVNDQVLVKLLWKKDDFKISDKIDKPFTRVKKSPKQVVYGLLVDWADMTEKGIEYVKKMYPDEQNAKATYATVKYLNRNVEPGSKVAAFSRARYLEVQGQDGKRYSFVKMPNLLWLEDYDEEGFKFREEASQVDSSYHNPLS